MKMKIWLGIFITLCLLAGSILWFGNNTTSDMPEVKNTDAPSTQIEPISGMHAQEPKIDITASIDTIGTREFNMISEGNFDHFACKAIKETVYELPVDKDIIVTAGLDKPFEVFRLDILAETLKKQNLPFIVWEDVPVEDRPRAHFSTIATLRWGKTTDNKPAAVPLVRDRKVMEMIDYTRAVSLYPEFGMGSKSAPVRKYKLTDVHSLLEIQGYYGLAEYDEILFQNWTKGYSPYAGGASVILGPFITLRHPPENAEAVAIASSLLDQQNALLEIFRDDKFLYTVTVKDHIRYSKRAAFIKVTRFDPSQFAHVIVDGETAVLSSKIFSVAPQGEAVKLCELTLELH